MLNFLVAAFTYLVIGVVIGCVVVLGVGTMYYNVKDNTPEKAKEKCDEHKEKP